MCHTEHVFHRPCGHWGRDRIVGEPCCRSRISNGRHVGCHYPERYGTGSSSSLCPTCKYRLQHSGSWIPSTKSSDGSWARIDERLTVKDIWRDGSILHCGQVWVWLWSRNERGRTQIDGSEMKVGVFARCVKHQMLGLTRMSPSIVT